MKICFKALGTDISIQIISDDVADGLENEIKNFYFKKEKIFSRFLENSELGKLNKNLGRYNSVSADILEVVRKCLEYNKTTENYFDLRIIEILENIGYDRDFKSINVIEKKSETVQPLQNSLADDLRIQGGKVFFGTRMDFSGIAKGYITDKMVEYLSEKGYENFLVDSGGDIRVSGRDEKRENWRISLEGIAEEKILLEMNNDFPAVATSGVTRRKWENKKGKFHHLINPKNPSNFSFDLKTVTVVAKTCEEADVWAKVLFLMGKEKGMKFSEDNDIKSLFWDYKGNIFLSPKVKKNIGTYALASDLSALQKLT